LGQKTLRQTRKGFTLNKIISTFVRFFLVLGILLPVAGPGLPSQQAAAAPSVDYSISGRVTDSNGNPVSGVTVQASLSPTPIIFVHGFRGFPPKLIGCNDSKYKPSGDDIHTPGDIDDYFGQVEESLKDHYPIYYAHLVTNPCYTAPLEENAEKLRQDIEAVKKAANNAPKVILITHSMGGLVSRAYVEGNNYNDDVETLITLGSPHIGIPLDLIAFLANGISVGVFCKDYQPGLCDFSVTGMALFNINHLERENGVRYFVISGDAPLYSRNALGLATNAILRLPNDGIVQEVSGLGLWDTGNVQVKKYTTDENHNIFSNDWAGFHWTYFDTRKTPFASKTSSKSYNQCLQPILIDNASQCIGSQLAVTQPSTVEVLYGQRTAFDVSLLLPGQTRTYTIALQNAPTLFAANWLTGTVNFALQTPEGVLIDPAYAITNPGFVTYTTSTGTAVYEFPSASAGSWKLILSGASLPPAGTNVVSFAAFSSDLQISGGAERFWYSVNDIAIITATLQGAILDNAWVTATLTYVDDTFTVLPLKPAGNGLFRAELLVPAKSGYADVVISATGNALSQRFERSINTAFQIAPNTISLTNNFTETPQPHSPESSLYASLDISVGVNVVVSGTYGLAADLVDSQGRTVAHSMVIKGLPIGFGSLPLIFGGNDIFAAGLNGPYILTNLLLTDQTGNTLIVDQADNLYTTAEYDYHNFGDGNLKMYLPLVVHGTNGQQTAQTIQTATSFTTQTDTNGNYTFANLPAGNYYVSPSQSGQTFSPPFLSMPLPPNASNQNFTRQGASLLTPTPTLIITPSPSGKPSLSNPGNGASLASSTDVTLQWNTVSGATQYKVELWGGPYSLMTPCDWQSGTSCHIGTMWPGTMSWHVKAKNATGQESSWSDTWTFTIQNATATPIPTVGKPSLSSPNNGASLASNTDVTLLWNTVSGVTQYKVELWGGPYSLMTPCDWQSGTSCHIGTMWPGTMSWHVKAKNANGQESSWSDTWTFTIQSATATPIPTVGKPSLSSPGNGASLASSTDVTLQWNTVSGATQYKVELWGGPYSLMTPCDWQSGTSCHIGTMWPGTMSWHVKAKNATGQESSWSDTWTFTIQSATATPIPPTATPSWRPSLSSPSNGASLPKNTDVTLRWNSLSGATQYKVELWGGPYSLMTPCDWQSGTSCHIGTMWPGNMVWHVKARNSSGQESSWSEDWNFTIQN
jgi:pimeloyl-ACP methyl ester carboxylesterase